MNSIQRPALRLMQMKNLDFLCITKPEFDQLIYENVNSRNYEVVADLLRRNPHPSVYVYEKVFKNIIQEDKLDTLLTTLLDLEKRFPIESKEIADKSFDVIEKSLGSYKRYADIVHIIEERMSMYKGDIPPASYNNLAHTYIRLKKLDSLEELVKSHFSYIDKNSSYLTGLINAYIEVGHYEKAELMMNSSDNPYCHLWLSINYAKCNEIEKGKSIILKFYHKTRINISSFTINTLIKKSLIYGKVQKALDIWENFPKLDLYLQPKEQTTSMLNSLARACINADRTDMAKDVLKSFKKHFIPSNDQSIDILVELFKKNKELDIYQVFQYIGANVDVILLNGMITRFKEDGKYTDRILEVYKCFSKYNLVPDTSICNACMIIYGKQGKLDGALEIFNDMHTNRILRDRISYNTIIKCYRRNHNCEKALEVLEARLQKYVLNPEEMHIYRAILGGFVNEGKIDKAEEMFNKYEGYNNGKPDIICLNTLLHAYAKHKSMDKAMELYSNYQKYDVVPDTITINTLVNGFLLRGQVDEALSVLHSTANASLDVNTAAWTSVITAYIKKGNNELAVKLITELEGKGCIHPILHSLLVRAYVGMNRIEKAIEAFHDKNFEPNACSLLTILIDCIKKCRFKLAVEFWDYFKVYNILPNNQVINAIMDAYIGLGEMKKALQIFNLHSKLQIKVSNHSLNTLMKGFTNINDMDSALLIFNKTLDMNLYPDTIALNTLLNGFVKQGRMDKAMCVLSKFPEFNIKTDVHALNTIVSGYTHLGDMDKALRILAGYDKFNLKPDEYTLNTVVNGYTIAGDMDKALHCFELFERYNIQPGLYTWSTLMHGHILQSNIDKALEIFNSLPQIGLEPEVVTLTTIITGLVKTNKLNEAVKFFECLKMHSIAVDSWFLNSIIYTYAKLGQVEKVYEVFTKFSEFGLIPNAKTITSMMVGYVHIHQYEKAIELFKLGSEYGVVYGLYSYTLLIDVYLQLGDIDKVTQVFDSLEDLSIKPDYMLLTLMLKTYMHYGDLDRAKNISTKLHAIEMA